MIPFSLQQSQPPQLIDLSQLHNHNHHPNVVSTGLRLSFGDQQQQLQQHHHNQQQQNCHSSSSLFSVLAEDFATQIKQQRDELDQFLQAQVIIFTLLRWVSRNFESSGMGFLTFFLLGRMIEFFWVCNFLGGTATAHISREAAEALPYATGRSGGIYFP